MTVVNLNPGQVLEVGPNQIRTNVHVYRTNQGYDGPGDVSWVPNGGAVQITPLAVGQTITFAINGRPGMIANGCPSKVQVLYDNGAALRSANIRDNAVKSILSNRAAASAGTAEKSAVGDTSPSEQVMATFNSQWYNAVVTGCSLDPDTFQLFQGNTPIGSTSEWMWNILDVVPPLSVSNYYNPSQSNVFSTDYGAVINNLIPQNSQSFQNDMGDYYSQWMTYLSSVTILPQGGLLALFQNWSLLHMPPEQAQQCYTDYQQVSQGAVPVAVQMWINAGGGTGGTKAYNATISQMKNALQSARGVTFNFNTATESADISNTWAKVETKGMYDFFSGEASGEYEHLTTALSQVGLSVEVVYESLVTFPCGPLSKPSSDPILSQYQPWFSSAALNLAYQNNNNRVWKNTAPTWSNTFGPNGNMLRTASALVVVDGVTITMTSNSAITTTDQSEIKAAMRVGFWPFFEADGSGGWMHDVSFNSEGFMTVTSTCSTGNPNILGVIVTPIAGALLYDNS